MLFIKNIIKQTDRYVFLLTMLLFSLIPVALILLGGFSLITIPFSLFYESINLNDLWIILVGSLMIWVGFQWDDAVIEHYPTAIERKKNEEKHKLKQEDSN